MRRRGQPSPDQCDAAALAFAAVRREAQIHGREIGSIIVSENITALSFREHIHYYAQVDRLLA